MISYLLFINQYCLDFLNSFLEIPFISKFAPIFADLPIFFLPIFLVVTWIYYGIHKERSKQETLLSIFMACVVSLSISIIIQQFIHLDRPDLHIKHVAHLILNKIPEASFPSDHASISIAFVTALYFGNYKKVFWFFLPFAILMNLCRIIVGVHWPFDILVGSIVGIFSGIITLRYIVKMRFVKKVNSFIIYVSSFFRL